MTKILILAAALLARARSVADDDQTVGNFLKEAHTRPEPLTQINVAGMTYDWGKRKVAHPRPAETILQA
jgi:hypothetical protein